MTSAGIDTLATQLPDEHAGPRLRIELLCDPGSVQVIRSAVRSTRIGDRAQPGDGVVAASGEIGGRPVLCYAEDAGFVGGSLGEAHADTIVRVLLLAQEAQVPVIGLIESAGARVQEGAAALNGYARIFRSTVALSGRVPQISIVTGTCAGGGSYAPALTDFIVMTKPARMFLTGPEVVKAAVGEEVDPDDLGGWGVHARNGVAQFSAPSDLDAILLGRDLLSYLPQSAGESPPRAEPREPLGGNPGACVPRETRRVYDVRDVIARIVDGGELLEYSPRWARNMVTAFAHIDGRSVGIVANQPRYLGGAIDCDASEKGARFVRMCDDFRIPLVVLVDTPGFVAGTRQEKRGIIRRGADLVRAFAHATVPKLTVILRQAYGGAYITMNAKDLGADLAFAWPRARVGIMSAVQAVSIIERRRIAAAPDPDAERMELAEHYADEHQGAHAVATEGFLDEVISPGETRSRLSRALGMLADKPNPLGGGRIEVV